MAKKKNNKMLYMLLGAFVLLLVIVVIAKKSGAIGGTKAVTVSAEEAIKRSIVETVAASGKIQPEVEVNISADVSGEIVALPVKEGDAVKKGQLLVKIQPDIYQAAVERARAALNTAKANLANTKARQIQNEARFVSAQKTYERSEKLYKEKLISDAEWENAVSTYAVAKADVEAGKESVAASGFSVASANASLSEALESLRRTSIYAPMDGTVSRLNVELGERVVGTVQMTGTEIMRVANLDRMEVVVEVNENDINRVKLNDTVSIEVDAFNNEVFTGIVTEMANSALLLGSSAEQVTNFEVKIRILKSSYAHLLENAVLPSPFRPGLSATVDIRTKKESNHLTVPIQSVTTKFPDQIKRVASKKEEEEEKEEKSSAASESFKEYVFVVAADNTSELREVKTGIQDDTYICILEGLKEGDKIVSGPYLAISKTLKDGSSVEVVAKEKLFQKTEK